MNFPLLTDAQLDEATVITIQRQLVLAARFIAEVHALAPTLHGYLYCPKAAVTDAAKQVLLQIKGIQSMIDGP